MVKLIKLYFRLNVFLKTRLRLGVTPHKHCVCVETSSPVFTFHEYKQGQANFGVQFVVGWLLFCIVVLFCFHTLLSHLFFTLLCCFVFLLCYFILLSHLVIVLCSFTLLLYLEVSSYSIVLSFHFVALFCCFFQFVTSSCFITLLHRFVILPCCFFFWLNFCFLFMKFFSFVYMFCLFSINVLVYVMHCARIFGY